MTVFWRSNPSMQENTHIFVQIQLVQREEQGNPTDTQNYLASRNWSEILSHLLRKKSLNLVDNSRIGQHWVARVGTDIQNRSMPFLLEAHIGVIDLLFLRHLSSTWWRTSTKDQSQIPSFESSLLPWTNHSRGKKHGEAQWHRDHWKAMDARRAWKHNKDSIVIKWQEDHKYRRYLDYLTTIDISHTAPWYQRHRYESTITLVCNDEDR